MNLIAIARRFNAARDRRKARKAIPLRPDDDYRTRRLAQFTPERRARYWRNVEGLS